MSGLQPSGYVVGAESCYDGALVSREQLLCVYEGVASGMCSMQCSISALYALESRIATDGAETMRTSAVRRLVALCQSATADLERHLAGGSSGVSLAAEPRMSYCEDAAIVPLMTSVNYTNSMNHRQQVWNIIERWNAECEKLPGGAPEEQKVGSFIAQ